MCLDLLFLLPMIFEQTCSSVHHLYGYDDARFPLADNDRSASDREDPSVGNSDAIHIYSLPVVEDLLTAMDQND